jgi:regulatory protein
VDVVGRRRGRAGRGWDAAPPRTRSIASGAWPDEAQIRGDWQGETPEHGRPASESASGPVRGDDDLDEDGWPRGSVPAPRGRGRPQARGFGAGRRGANGDDGSRQDRGGPGQTDGQPEQDPAERAREICLRLLAVRPRTRTELATALRQRGIAADVAAEVLERYSEVGIIDDQAFARAWVSSRHHGRGLAKRALATELRQKGVGDEAAGAALAELDPDTEAATARALVERKLRSTPGGTPDALLRRLVGLLARKGYPAGLAIRVVREVLAERAADTDATSAELDEWAADLDPGTREAEANGPDGEDLP